MDLLNFLESIQDENKSIKANEDLAFVVSQNILLARMVQGFTQEKLAKKMKTNQSSIARIEAGNYLPNLKYIERIAKALNTEVIAPSFSCITAHRANKIINYHVFPDSSYGFSAQATAQKDEKFIARAYETVDVFAKV